MTGISTIFYGGGVAPPHRDTGIAVRNKAGWRTKSEINNVYFEGSGYALLIGYCPLRKLCWSNGNELSSLSDPSESAHAYYSAIIATEKERTRPVSSRW